MSCELDKVESNFVNKTHGTVNFKIQNSVRTSDVVRKFKKGMGPLTAKTIDRVWHISVT